MSITIDPANNIELQLVEAAPVAIALSVGQGPAGATGPQGPQGDEGRGIVSIARTSGTGAPGTTDTYTITYNDASTSTFEVYNGANGAGAGDMLKSVYDTDNDGVVDAAESVPWAGVSDKPDLVLTTGAQNISDKTIASPIFTGRLQEQVFAVTGTTPALSPSNGTIQTWTLSGNSTPTAGTWNSGESLTLMVDDGTAFTITWTSIPVIWKTNSGSAPTLITTGYTVVELWKVDSTIYGARVGNA